MQKNTNFLHVTVEFIGIAFHVLGLLLALNYFLTALADEYPKFQERRRPGH